MLGCRRRNLALAASLAAAILFASMPALAQSSNDTSVSTDVSVSNSVAIDISTSIEVTKNINVTGNVTITGNIAVSQAVMALIDNNQVINDSTVSLSTPGAELANITVLGTDVLQTSSGNIGVNLASGASMLQENSTTLSSQGVAGPGASAEAEVISLQKSFNNTFNLAGAEADVINAAELLGNVLAGATGNIGVNVAVGAFHAQNNSLSLAAATGTTVLAQSTAAVVQQISFTKTLHVDTSNSVVLGDSVLQGASGNIGLNITAGTNNLQQNTLVISSGN